MTCRLHLDWDTRRLSVRTTIDLREHERRSRRPVASSTRWRPSWAACATCGSAWTATAVGPRSWARPSACPWSAPLADGATSHGPGRLRARACWTTVARGFFFTRLGGVAQLYRFIPWLSRRIPFGSQDHGEPFLTPGESARGGHRHAPTARSCGPPSGRRVGPPEPAHLHVTWPGTCATSSSPPAPAGGRSAARRRTAGHVHRRPHRRLDARRLVTLARRELARYEQVTGVRLSVSRRTASPSPAAGWPWSRRP